MNKASGNLFTIFLLLFWLFPFVAFGKTSAEKLHNDKILCSGILVWSLKPKVENLANDKLKHCSLSCMLTLRCSSFDVWQLGLVKEIWDVVGDGNAEWKDLEADLKGIRFGRKIRRNLNDDLHCIKLCSIDYPEK